jgi:hypothetical protein
MTITVLTPTITTPTLAAPEEGPGRDPGVVLAAYARQVDELARLVEDWQTACAGYARVLAAALGELHVVLDETAHTFRDQPKVRR